jgi:hypothetical protein
LTTKRLLFNGDELDINGAGPIEVEALNGNGERLGIGNVEGDSLAHRIRIGAKSLREAVPSAGVRLRFTVRPPGRLYSFTIR